ncbi:myosin phosphatase Rho-interacting protein-like isoform X2 [Xyrauchen texanus]|uniref:myosin phosphatase Rho-interacting protein-like isoform X2 n=1 Tax=Xyrauchen texanus TaxID=154827 RepID=UPI002241D46D|nr:myosin phosphatase Rho-interacting protein-like isoform X2 [Xyrauchen texanus]
MTRLDLPPHRTSPRGWTEISHGHDSFGQFSFSHGSVKDRRERESGNSSLGRAAGSRAFSDKSPPAPYRHSERGHPLPSNKSPEPKASIPFRNPDLGVPSERRTSEIHNPELPPMNYTPELLDLNVEVEALAGPRSLSPTPFKQAESLITSSRKGGRNVHSSPTSQPGMLSSSQRGSSLSRSTSPGHSTSPFKRAESSSTLNMVGFRPSSVSSPTRQPGMLSSSQRGPSLVQSSSPSRSASPFRRAESSSSLNMVGFRSSGVSQGQASSTPSRNSYSGGMQKNFRSLASTMSTVISVNKSLSHMDLRGTLRKSETNSSIVGSIENRGSSSTSRNGYDSPGQNAVWKTETKSPPYERSHDRQSSSPSRRCYDTRSQTPMGSIETSRSERQIQEGRRSATPVRKGYGTPSQSEKISISKGWSHDKKSPSPSRKGYEAQSQLGLKKSEAKSSLHSHNQDSRHSSPRRVLYQNSGQSLIRKTETRQSSSSHGLKSHSPSSSRWGNDAPNQSLPRKSESGRNSSMSTLRHDPACHTPLRNTMSDRTDSTSYVRNTMSNQSHQDSNPSSGHWRGSSHSLLNQSDSRNSSPSHHSSEKKQFSSSQKSTHVVRETSQNESRRSSVRLGQEVQNTTPKNHRSLTRSPSPPLQRHTSSQSSMDSESSHLSAGSSGLNREEYTMMADLPKVKTVFQREDQSHLGRIESRQRREPLYKPASHSQTKAPHSDWDEAEDERDSGTLSRAHSSSSLHTQRASTPTTEKMHICWNLSRTSGQNQKAHRPSVYFSCSVEQTDEESIQQPDLLNFKKGWMSKLDESGEWRKHWFVLTDAGLKYYRDSAAEERDDVDGEIDLKSCVKVCEFDVEKNYGFQIQTRDAMFTLSAMTAGIRRNWIEVLRKSVRPNSSPDLTQLPDCSGDKENIHHRLHRQSDAASTANIPQRKFDYVELSPVATPSTPASASQRESGEGQVKEHSQWQEERVRDDTHSQWEAVLSRKGAGQLSEQRRIEEEIERKWAEFERLPLKGMRSLPPMGARSGPLANQALEREVASLRQQLVELRAAQGGREGSCRGAESRCSESLQQMERMHRETLQELHKQHAQQISALERERDALLREETEATARVMEALQKAYKEELEKTTRLAERHGVDTHTLDKQQQAEMSSLRRELDCLSERYSHKCLELNRAQQHNTDTERQMRERDTQIEQLKRDNQDLQARLSEEIKVIQSVVTGQGSDAVSDGSDRSWCETQVLLRLRENELQYLHKEINSLRNQLHFITTEKSSVCERYREVSEELNVMKSRSEREIETLREHLSLALNALQEEQHIDNTLQH